MHSISLKSSDYGLFLCGLLRDSLVTTVFYVAQASVELIPPTTPTILSFKLYFIFVCVYTSKRLFSFLPEGSMKTGSCKQHLNGTK